MGELCSSPIELINSFGMRCNKLQLRSPLPGFYCCAHSLTNTPAEPR